MTEKYNYLLRNFTNLAICKKSFIYQQNWFLFNDHHELKRCLLLGRKVMTKLDSIFKSRDITLPTKVCLVKAMVFPVVMYGYEIWTVKKVECWRIFFCFKILYWFCHTSTWIRHGCTRVPNHEPPSQVPPHTIPLGHPRAPAPSILYPASNLDWWFVSYMIVYMFQCHSPKSFHPRPLPQSPKDCSIHLCFFCCLTYKVITTIFLNSIYTR